MNCVFSNEESSSGSESGWTLYLDHSSSSFNQENDYIHKYIGNSSSGKQLKEENEEEETEYEEDLSMVSDASSGPAPHLHEEDSSDTGNYNFNRCLYQHQDFNRASFSGSYGEKFKETRRLKKNNDRFSLLDDTASSPLLDYSTKTFSASRAKLLEEGYSSTQFQVRPDDYNMCYKFLPTSMCGDELQQDQWSQRKRC